MTRQTEREEKEREGEKEREREREEEGRKMKREDREREREREREEEGRKMKRDREERETEREREGKGEGTSSPSVSFIVSRTGRVVHIFPPSSSPSFEPGSRDGGGNPQEQRGRGRGMSTSMVGGTLEALWKERKLSNPPPWPDIHAKRRQAAFGPSSSSCSSYSSYSSSSFCHGWAAAISQSPYSPSPPLFKTPMKQHFPRLLEDRVRIGLSQLSTLQRWEEGTREVASRWTSWLLRLLRKAKPPPMALQFLLFTVCASVLPLVSYSLVQQTWIRSQQAELLRSVDILWRALKKSHSCFSGSQWKILGGRIDHCHRLRMKVANWVGKYWQPSVCPKIIARFQSCETSLSVKLEMDVDNEHKSNALVLKEGVQALVKCALEEKLCNSPFSGERTWNKADPTRETWITVPLICPLSGGRIKVPARGIGCLHQNCFDLQPYLEVHAKMASIRMQKCGEQRTDDGYPQNTWRCPICGANTSWSRILIDDFFMRMLKDLPQSCLSAYISSKGGWKSVEQTIEEPKEASVEMEKSDGTLLDSECCLGYVTEGCCGIGLPSEQVEEICRAAKEAASRTSLSESCNSSSHSTSSSSSNPSAPCKSRLSSETSSAANGTETHCTSKASPMCTPLSTKTESETSKVKDPETSTKLKSRQKLKARKEP